MAETMTALVERNRAHVAAHTVACAQSDWTRETEAAFFASADTAAGITIEADPPRLRDKADLVAAISYVAEDVDFLQKGHGRVLARVLEYLTAPAPNTICQHTEAAGESIEDMASRLRAIYERDTSHMTDEESDASCAVFDALQAAIISAEPKTPRDVALQFMADTHYSASDLSDGFVDRLIALSGQEAPK